ncbi:hypothetical protein [Ruegeria arenilitoris]|uniref:hypothetical protein n=1 Tax=Ruegeria arenilitoris TaxID=1173585 RepID=UPI00148126D7|nr:hypothetical protein [Ruegeria arenilitoris]
MESLINRPVGEPAGTLMPRTNQSQQGSTPKNRKVKKMENLSFADLVKAGDPEAVEVDRVMRSPAYSQMNGNNAEMHEFVSRWFQKRFGTGPASGTTQNNTISRGGWR